nr:formin-like protein 5 [Lolium perenne]
MGQLMKDTDICSDDIIRTFISRRVLPLKHRAHKMSEMYGPGDPTKITCLPLSKEDAKQRFPRIAAEQRGPCRNRALDTVDPDPYIHWTDIKMGRTHTPRPDAPSAGTNPQVLDHVTPLQAEVGHEFLEKLTSQGKKKKAPASEAGPSEAPPAKRQRQDVVGGKVVSKKNYRRREMPVSSGAALKTSKSASGIPPESSEEAVRPSPPPQPSPAPSGAGNSSASPPGGTTSAGHAAPTPPDHRAEGDKASPPEIQDTGASNIGANTEDAGGLEPLAPTAPKKKKKKKTADSSSSKPVPDSSAPAGSAPGQDAPDARSPLKTTPAPPPENPTGKPTVAKPTPPPSKGPSAAEPTPFSRQGPATAKPPPPPEGTKPLKPEPSKAEATASGTPASGPQPLVLHAGHAAVVAGEKASGQLGQITELTRGGNELGHLLDYAEKWN